MTIIPDTAQAAAREAQRRADYIRGLRALADLLADNDDLTLPYQGHAGLEKTVFISGQSPITQTLLLVQAMDEPPGLSLQRQSSTLTWLDVKGRIAGLHLTLHLRAQEVCEMRVVEVYQAADGSKHEVKEFVIPAELLAACRPESLEGAR